MNIWRIIIMSLWLLSVSEVMQAQNYERLWQRVEQLEKDDLPKSVVEAAEVIYRKAEKEKNVPQMMKAFLTMTFNRMAISPDSMQVDMQKLEEWASSSKTPMQDKAVLYSILGGMTIHKDFEKGNTYLNLSLKDSLALVTYDAGKFIPLVKVGETSRRYFNNNLYELLARRAIRLWKQNGRVAVLNDVYAQINQIYHSLLSLYERTGNRSAWLLTALDAFPDADNAQLRNWIKEYGDVEVCAEVYLRLADRLYWSKPSEALAIVREAISRYPKYERVNALKNKEKEILLPRLEMSLNNAYPNDSMKLDLGYCNLTRISILLYRVNLTADSPLLSKVNVDNVANYGTLVRKEEYTLEPSVELIKREFILKAPPAGIYYVVVKPSDRKGTCEGVLLHLTGLQMIQRTWNKRCEFVVVDKRTGHPVPKAQVVFYTQKEGRYTQQEVHTTDDQGNVWIPVDGKDGRQKICRAVVKGDEAMAISHVWIGSDGYTSSDSTEKEWMNLFTDRGIYRPGQRIYYSGIVYKQREDKTRVVENKVLKVKLLDANRKLVGEQDVKTDAFGTLSGEFSLPVAVMPGYYELRINNYGVSVRVEEYKRPTFEVQFDSLEQVYQLGDSVEVIGTARTYSGTPVQHAKVKYRIVGMENYYWRMNPTSMYTASGETTTDAEGRFIIPAHLQVNNARKNQNLLYKITADVTTLSGETQQGETVIPVEYSGMDISLEGWKEEVIVKENGLPLNFKVVNSSGTLVSTVVTYQVYRILGEERKECVLTADIPSNTKVVPEQLYTLPSGNYLLKATVKGVENKEVSMEHHFVLFSYSDRKLPYEADAWGYQTDDTFDPQKPVSIYFGSCEPDVYLFYDVFSENRRLESKRIVLSDSLLTFRFPYKEEYGDGIRVYFAFVKNGEIYGKNFRINKPIPEKELKLTWNTFRDKLQPGQKETWTLNVRYPDGRPAEAQLMASMYDASLDRFLPHAWTLDLYFPRHIPFISWKLLNRGGLYWSCRFPDKHLACPDFRYSTLDFPAMALQEREEIFFGMEARSPRVQANRLQKTSVASKYDAALEMEEEAMSLKPAGEVQLRSNFAETAFFYPQLRTNAQGEVQLEFTLPESLTEWKFMGLAHTKDMDYGQLNATITASKDFMLQPNLPRFVRVGDEVSFTASLINLTEKEMKGVVRMELFNPETDKVFKVQKKSFKVGPKETDAVSFSFTVKAENTVLACRMVAEGNGFSDGEQRYLPVLTDKQWLTESVAFTVDTAGIYSFSLDELFNHHSKTVTNPRMVVEYTGNPAWYAVQALPVLANPENENAYSWATAYYANTLAVHIARSNPRIRQVVESWAVKQGDGRELQNTSETPWSSEVMTETEQRQRLSTLFDENTMDYKRASCVEKLKDLQQENGAWSWYKGMPGNRYMTTQIMELLARLRTMTGEVAAHKDLLDLYKRGFRYLTQEVVKEYENLRETEKEGSRSLGLSEQTLKYLYICALDSSLQTDKKMTDYFLSRLENHSSSLTIYGKALAAVILQHSGRMDKAKAFMQSILEYSVYTEEMGRYFDTPKAAYSWCSYKIPTEVAVMEAVNGLSDSQKIVEQMKQWLLKQKQAQHWDMPIATADAVYALLTTGKDLLANEAKAQLIVGKEIMDVPDSDALGYLKQTVAGNVMDVESVTVKKESDGMAWGAVYAQFLEKMDDVKSQSGALSVSRSLYKGNKQVAGNELMVGDRVTVRLTVTSDRDMDFVQLKDERAACMEPVDVLSTYHWKNGLGYCQVTKDASTSFFFDQLRKGTHVLEYDVYITASGEYGQGAASVCSVYAPEFSAHSDTMRLNVK